jgi:hypothetical protein
MTKTNLTVYELASDVSTQLYILRYAIVRIARQLDSFCDKHGYNDGDSNPELGAVYEAITEANSYCRTLYTEYLSVAAETINKG